MSYDSIKSYMRDHRQSVIIAILFVAIFGVGYGTGSSWHASGASDASSLRIKQNNYNTKSAFTQTAEGELPERRDATAIPEVKGDQTTVQKAKDNPTQPVEKSTTSSTPAKDCPVKGNISKDSKIYHVPGGSFYNRVKPEQCFQTEAEAKAAGFRKSAR